MPPMMRSAVFLVTVVLTVASSGVLPAPEETPGSTMIQLHSDRSKCLDVRNDNEVEGELVRIAPCKDTPAQDWRVTDGIPQAIEFDPDRNLCLFTGPYNSTLQSCYGSSVQSWTYDLLSKTFTLEDPSRK
ncbi:hypothetical protein H0H93_006852 [Arthromyces matolae]|nr:hypothetical protein H0H93_006852 [Arthromyces matolae]